MRQRIRSHLTYANVTTTILLFLVLTGGVAYAANTVFSSDIVDNQVYSADVRNDSLAGGGLRASDLGPGSVGSNEVINGSLIGADIQAHSLTPPKFGTLPAARATNSTSETIPDTTSTDLTLDTERFDTAGLHSTSSNTTRMTAPIKGTYVITGNVAWEGNTSGHRALSIARNGTTDIANVTQTPFDSGPNQSVTTVTRLSAGDYVTLRVLQDNAAHVALKVRGTDFVGPHEFSPELAMAWIGP